MPRLERTEEEKKYSEDYIRADFLAGRVTVLHNESMLYVRSKKIFATDFPWFESLQKDEDGEVHGDCFSVLVPLSARNYFLDIRRDPMTPFTQDGKYNLEIMDVKKDLHLTETEARLWHADTVGAQTIVMKGIRHPIIVKDPVRGTSNIVRYGIHDVIAPASGEAGEPTPETIGDFAIDTGMYRGHRMNELSDDYIMRQTMQGGTSANPRVVALCKLEFQRRQNALREPVQSVATIPIANPVTGEVSVQHCEGTKTNGDSCKQIHGLEIADDGKFYCHAHYPGGES